MSKLRPPYRKGVGKWWIGENVFGSQTVYITKYIGIDHSEALPIYNLVSFYQKKITYEEDYILFTYSVFKRGDVQRAIEKRLHGKMDWSQMPKDAGYTYTQIQPITRQIHTVIKTIFK